MTTTYTNEVNRSGLMKSPVPIDGSDDIILFIPYSLIATDGAANTAAVAALFLSWDSDGNKSGILYDWPVLG